MNSRPELNEKLSVEDFTGFYWLKKELVVFCKTKGISTTGNKLDLTSRICIFLQRGEIIGIPTNKKHKSTSDFNWKKSILSPDTLITDNYKNT